MLPVNPPDIELEVGGSNKTVDTAKLGEVNILKTAKLAGMTIESFFPLTHNGEPYILPSAKDLKKPEAYFKFFQDARDAGEPVIFKLTGISLKGKAKGILLSVESIKEKITGGDIDSYYTLELKEFKNYGKRTFTSTFKVPVDEQGIAYVQNKQGALTRLQNTAAKAKSKAIEAKNVASQASRYAQTALKTVNAIKSTGTIINCAKGLSVGIR